MHAPGFLILATLGLAACGTTAKEPSRAASSAPSVSQAAKYEVESAQASPPPAEEDAATKPTGADQSPRGSVAASRDDESPNNELRRQGVDGGPSSASGKTASAKPKKASTSDERKEEASPKARAAAPAAPAATPQLAYAEPPDLHAAMVEFDAAFDQLSTSHDCEDACRALASMRRAAQRICDLVISSDPRGRCRNARARLDSAAKDLEPKCTCP